MKKSNVFVIHPFKEQKDIIECTNLVYKNFKHFKFFILKNDVDDWEGIAEKEIMNSELVLAFLTSADNYTDNMRIEKKIAEENKKQIIEIQKGDREKCPEKIKDALEPWTEENLKIEILSEGDKELLERQYRTLIDSSESLITRRQTTGDRYATICCAILTIIGTIIVLSDLDSGFTPLVATILSGTGIFISWSWFRFIKSLGKINRSKYRIIQIMEKELPAKMFYAEWKDMTNPIGGGYKSYSEAEKNTPIIMMILFIGVFGLCLLMLYNNWDSIVNFFG
ncbi:MAG: hypothetical protein FWG96_01025 [Methanomassiliicoccaceae archaeon]|nr:hypothetical protein [Methanomassiliicoccaceae archaeon]